MAGTCQLTPRDLLGFGADVDRFGRARVQRFSADSNIPMWMLENDQHFTDTLLEAKLDEWERGEPILPDGRTSLDEGLQQKLRDDPSTVFWKTFESGVRSDLDVGMKYGKYAAIGIGALVLLRVLKVI